MRQPGGMPEPGFPSFNGNAPRPTTSDLKKFGPNFERARNTRDLDVLGDPEMWGGQDTITATGGNNIVESRQLVRVQCKDLLSRMWEGFANFTMRKPPAGAFTGAVLQLELVVGVGLQSQQSLLFLFSNVNPANGVLTALSSFDPTTTTRVQPVEEQWSNNFFGSGSFKLPPLPCSMLAVTARFAVFGLAANDGATITVGCGVAPRGVL